MKDNAGIPETEDWLMKSDIVQYEEKKGTALLTLNRPDVPEYHQQGNARTAGAYSGVSEDG